MLRSLSIKLSFQAVSLISLVVFKIPVSLMLSCFSTVCQMCIYFFIYPVFILMIHFFTYGKLLSFHMLNFLLPRHLYFLHLSWKTCSTCSPYLPGFFAVLLYFHIFISLYLCASFWMTPSMSLFLWCLGLCYLSQN